MTCSDAWLKAGMRGTDTKGEQREQRERRRVHTVPFPHTLQAGAIHLRNGGAHSSSCVPCDAAVWREPLREPLRLRLSLESDSPVKPPTGATFASRSRSRRFASVSIGSCFGGKRAATSFRIFRFARGLLFSSNGWSANLPALARCWHAHDMAHPQLRKAVHDGRVRFAGATGRDLSYGLDRLVPAPGV